jgi:proteasome activator subunit 4
MDLMLNCLSDDNVEVREMASSALSGIVRVSQRQSIIPLKVIPFLAVISRPILM